MAIQIDRVCLLLNQCPSVTKSIFIFLLEESSLKYSVLSCPSVAKFLQALVHGKTFNNHIRKKLQVSSHFFRGGLCL